MSNSISKDVDKVIDWLKKQVEISGTKGMLVGLSGGIDSAVVGNLLYRAFGENSLGVILPCKSSGSDEEDALAVAQKAGMPYVKVDLTNTHNMLLSDILDADDSVQDDNVVRLMDANLRARLRMSTLYAIANKRGYLVAGTDNAAELLTGYFTKFGDGGVDVLPIAHLKKYEVYEWANYLEVPQSVISRPPSAGLWEGQTDEKEMGVSYSQIDAYLSGEEISEDAKNIIERLNRNSEHKRNMPTRPF